MELVLSPLVQNVTSNGAGNIATGANANATGDGAIATGLGSVANGNNALAVGTNTSATGANDVALGAGSVTGSRNALTSITINGTEVGNNGKSSGTSVLAVGNSTSARQVQHVSAGLISADSTDAINGSQLYNVITVVNSTASTATAAKRLQIMHKPPQIMLRLQQQRQKVLQISVRLLQQLQSITATTAKTTAKQCIGLANQAANIYFHVNDGTEDIDRLPSEESLRTNGGSVRSSAGAQGIFSITAGMRATTTETAYNAIAMGNVLQRHLKMQW